MLENELKMKQGIKFCVVYNSTFTAVVEMLTLKMYENHNGK